MNHYIFDGGLDSFSRKNFFPLVPYVSFPWLALYDFFGYFFLCRNFYLVIAQLPLHPPIKNIMAYQEPMILGLSINDIGWTKAKSQTEK